MEKSLEEIYEESLLGDGYFETYEKRFVFFANHGWDRWKFYKENLRLFEKIRNSDSYTENAIDIFYEFHDYIFSPRNYSKSMKLPNEPHGGSEWYDYMLNERWKKE